MSVSRQLVTVLSLFLLCRLLSGCAAVLRPSEPNRLTIHSEPDSAHVYINGVYHAVTPISLSLPPESCYLLEVHKQGYQTGYDTVMASIGTNWLIADIVSSLPFFAVPIAVDGISGDWYTLDKHDNSRVFHLVPGTANHPALPTPQPLDSTASNLALLIELGVVFPSYQIPVLPQSYGVGIGYTPDPAVQCVARIEYNSIGISRPYRDNNGNISTTDLSTQIFSGMVGLRGRLFHTGIYATGGVGAIQAFIPQAPASTSGLLPLLTIGAGYVFPGEHFLLELRHIFVPTKLWLTSLQSAPIYLNHTVFRIGLVQPL